MILVNILSKGKTFIIKSFLFFPSFSNLKEKKFNFLHAKMQCVNLLKLLL